MPYVTLWKRKSEGTNFTVKRNTLEDMFEEDKIVKFRVRESSIMHKVRNVFLLSLAAIILSGCGSANQFVETEVTPRMNQFLGERMLEESDVVNNEDYQAYVQYKEEGELDDQGYYQENVELDNEKEGSIHVSFGENNNLDAKYYRDEACQQRIDTDNCYLNPGDKIYADIDLGRDVLTSMYSFSGIRVYSYDDNERRLYSEVPASGTDSLLVITVPGDLESSELSLEPIGTYGERKITLSDVCVEDNGDETKLNGNWIINDQEYTSGEVSLSPVTSYIISYSYDSDEFFYISSSPKEYYKDDGDIIFAERQPDDPTVNYSIQLHRYLTFTLDTDIDRKVTVSINNGDSSDEQDLKAGSKLTISHLRYGDRVRIQTDTSWEDLKKNRELIETDDSQTKDGFIYDLLVPQKDGEFDFNPADYQYEHGSLQFTCFGDPVDSEQRLAKGTKIYYSAKETEEGYYLPGDDDSNYVEVGEEEETIEKLKGIRFVPRKQVTVKLPQSKNNEGSITGGTVEYSIDGKPITSESINAYTREQIEIKATPWEGWTVDQKAVGTVTYQVVDQDIQTAHIADLNVDEYFSEAEDHKPALSVTLEKSIGTNATIEISASGYQLAATNYGGGWKFNTLINDIEQYDLISNDQTIVKGQKIGTDKGIGVKISNLAVQSGMAIRLSIIKTTRAGEEYKEIRYVDDLSNPIDDIEIYRLHDKSEEWYKAIDVAIGEVAVEKFAPISAAAHSKLVVHNKENDTVLKSNDYVEASQEVVVEITADSGYYVTGKNVSNDSYSKKMKYADYLKNGEGIVSDHPIKKFVIVTLDKSDGFAKYTYQIGDDEVSGNIQVHENQKIKLTYDLTGSEYRLAKKSGGFLGIGSSDVKTTKELELTSAYDGKTITKDDFGILIKGQ